MFNTNPIDILLSLPGIFIGFSIHEFAHAYTAMRLGDPTPKNQGRLTISPFSHIHLLGFILIVLTGIGWSKSVEININKLKNPKKHYTIVLLAGIMANFGAAVIFAGLAKLIDTIQLYRFIESTLYVGIIKIIEYTVNINIVLMIFNIIPVAPLDGYYLLFNNVSYKSKLALQKLKPYSIFILLIIIFLPFKQHPIKLIASNISLGIFKLFKY